MTLLPSGKQGPHPRLSPGIQSPPSPWNECCSGGRETQVGLLDPPRHSWRDKCIAEETFDKKLGDDPPVNLVSVRNAYEMEHLGVACVYTHR